MRYTRRTRVLRILAAGAVAAPMVVLAAPPPASANHPVFVEGNCFGPGAGETATGLQESPVVAGTCGDYDGDRRIGAAEDNDGDNSYGTIGGAVDAVANNGLVTVVANGTYPEIVRLLPTNGANITLQAAPGVQANIDAVTQGEPGGPLRANRPGIVVNGCDDCRVTVRNVVTRNWTDGVAVRGDSHAHLDEVISENNTDYGIHVTDQARVSISDSQVNATGFRTDANGPAQPDPGIGVEFGDNSRGSIYRTSITGSAAAGLTTEGGPAPRTVQVQLFDNRPGVATSARW